MHIFGDLHNVVHAWNSVDALVAGRLQHGRVIDVHADGLIIDFESPHQCSQFLESGMISDSSDKLTTENEWSRNRCSDNCRKTEVDVLQVLMRSRFGRPWVWYPAKFLPLQWNYEASVCGYVEVQLEDATVTEMLPSWQIFRRPAVDDLATRKTGRGHFVIRTCDLPSSCSSMITSALSVNFRTSLQRQSNVHWMSVTDDKLLYLQRADKSSIEPANLVECFQNNDKWEINDECKQVTSSKECQIPHQWHHHNAETMHSADKMGLPIELLTEIFQSFDSVHRSRCRRTCYLWNSILSSQANFTDIWIAGKDHASSSLKGHGKNVYSLANSLPKQPNNRIKSVTFTDAHYNEDCTDIALMNQLMQTTIPKLRRIVFHRCEFGMRQCVKGELRTLTCSFAVDCVIVWKDCRLSHPAGRLYADFSLTFENTKDSRVTDMESRLWDLFKKSLKFDYHDVRLPLVFM
ncbi:uncharacterized protein LOC129585616 [Paramacrobiotus metropolitanus]|uniref:uncharacterized protein LOC129585616 n=1 Tax=Paramacrobiotus metropolitanus TaxID=2943436 RepID=UPI002446067E|nr:uncharacterized protein LOC129585616 [Paramacrobiotus metropolitanus]